MTDDDSTTDLTIKGLNMDKITQIAEMMRTAAQNMRPQEDISHKIFDEYVALVRAVFENKTEEINRLNEKLDAVMKCHACAQKGQFVDDIVKE